jgi:hypothetical protein
MTMLQHKLSSEDRSRTLDPETLEDLDPNKTANVPGRAGPRHSAPDGDGKGHAVIDLDPGPAGVGIAAAEEAAR